MAGLGDLFKSMIGGVGASNDDGTGGGGGFNLQNFLQNWGQTAGGMPNPGVSNGQNPWMTLFHQITGPNTKQVQQDLTDLNKIPGWGDIAPAPTVRGYGGGGTGDTWQW